jgi:FkbM family methyltransferase
MLSIKGWCYYLQSIPTLVLGIRNWGAVFSMSRNRAAGKIYRIRLSDGSQFDVRTWMDVWVLKETCLDRQYERIGETIQDGWTVLDIGGGWGDFSISIAKKNPKSRVVAFEPYPPSIELFKRNQSLNMATNVELIEKAVGKKSGKLSLSGQSKEAVQISTAAGGDGGWLEVESLSLEDAFALYRINHCDFLKMDCEGGEYDILLAAPETVLAKIDRICMETHDGVTQFNHQDLVNFLQQQGFRVRYHVNPVHQSLGMLYAVRSGKDNGVS